MIENVIEFFRKLFIPKSILIIIEIVIVIIVYLLLLKISSSLLHRLRKLKIDKKDPQREAMIDTVLLLLQSVIKYVLGAIALIIIMSLVGIDVSSLLAGAGIAGLVIGLAMQTLIKDIITGMFIIFENQYNVGDTITIGDTTGVVEEIGFRLTRIRIPTGELHIIPNGSILKVVNHSQKFLSFIVDVSVNHNENLDRIINIIKEVGGSLLNDYKDDIPEPLVVSNILNSDRNIIIRVLQKVKAQSKGKMELEFRKRIKDRFDKENIEMYSKQIVVIEEKH